MTRNLNDIDKKNEIKQREERIKNRNKSKKEAETFDYDTETVINMTNKNNKQQQQYNKQQMSRKQKQILKRKKRIKRIVKNITLLLIVVAGIIFALVSPIFNIEKIEVLNNAQISSDTIISLSQLSLGQNIFKFNKNKTEKNIKTNAYIENVKIERKFPNKIEIQVEERQRDYNVEFLNGYAYINKQGYILEKSQEKLDLPTIQGISTEEEQIVEGNRLNSEDLEKLETVIQIMSTCKNYDLDTKVTTINIENKDEYSLYMEEEKKTIYLGNKNNLSNKMLYVKTIIEKNQGKEGYIYVDGDTNNNFKNRFREKV
ncbi:MAG: FtsQ-type POTRA domain-containing protein [Clostridia bacterium]